MASRLEASASTIVLFGPRASSAIATWQAGMLGRYLSIHKRIQLADRPLVPAREIEAIVFDATAKGVDQLVRVDLDHVGAEHHAETIGR